ncbi:MAG: VWA domain-containing protein [Candidatus Koribacter versatilis]|nr:VWA domain-containing protein [Candidatus Koribacter versatilis]
MKTKSYRHLSLLLFALCAPDMFSQGPKGLELERIVSIPVTVTKKDGARVTGLSAAVFALLEADRNRPVDSVTEVPPLLVGKNKTKVAFVLFDAITSPLRLQTEIRKDCLQALASSAINQAPMSLAEIDRDGLHVVHEVSTPYSTLAAALLILDGESPFLVERDQLRAIGSGSNDKSLISAETERLQKFRRGSIQSSNMMGRFLSQLKALQEMATALQRADGRKTVLWLTGYFPVEVIDVQDSININSFGITSGFPVKSASIDYQRTIDLLNSAQISVFPAQIVDNQSTTDSWVVLDFSQPLDRKTMTGLRQFAQSTGGEAMTASDTIGNLIKRAEDLTTSYYLLRFRPEGAKSDIKWRTLKVQVNGEPVSVKSPNGLFVFSPRK